MAWHEILSTPNIVPVTAIAGGILAGIVSMIIGAIRMQQVHAERMAMIAQGMHPDDPNKSQKQSGSNAAEHVQS